MGFAWVGKGAKNDLAWISRSPCGNRGKEHGLKNVPFPISILNPLPPLAVSPQWCLTSVSVCVSGCEVGSPSPGRLFMTDLLVSSLMADGGLETALRAAVKGRYRADRLGRWRQGGMLPRAGDCQNSSFKDI